MRLGSWTVMVCALLCAQTAAPTTYLESSDFIGQVFGVDKPTSSKIWLTAEVQEDARLILGHSYASLRIRYWSDQRRTAWILDEIGKDLPITIGVVVDGGRIADLQILAFRESRGGEVRYPFFTEQFYGSRLAGVLKLDKPIDGITGATMSVSAVERVARFALRLDQVHWQAQSPGVHPSSSVSEAAR